MYSIHCKHIHTLCLQRLVDIIFIGERLTWLFYLSQSNMLNVVKSNIVYGLLNATKYRMCKKAFVKTTLAEGVICLGMIPSFYVAIDFHPLFPPLVVIEPQIKVDKFVYVNFTGQKKHVRFAVFCIQYF